MLDTELIAALIECARMGAGVIHNEGKTWEPGHEGHHFNTCPSDRCRLYARAIAALVVPEPSTDAKGLNIIDTLRTFAHDVLDGYPGDDDGDWLLYHALELGLIAGKTPRLA